MNRSEETLLPEMRSSEWKRSTGVSQPGWKYLRCNDVVDWA